jgi:hypothetical protein
MITTMMMMWISNVPAIQTVTAASILPFGLAWVLIWMCGQAEDRLGAGFAPSVTAPRRVRQARRRRY